MGENSQYYKELYRRQLAKLRGLKKQLPYYTYDYLEDKERNFQINTVIAYAYDLITFFHYLIEKNPTLSHLTTDKIPINILEQLEFRDINEYQDYLKYNDGTFEHNNQSKAIARKMAALRGMFLYGCRHDIFTKDPTAGASLPKKEKEHVVVRMNQEEVRNVLDKIRYSEVSKERSRLFCEKQRYRDMAMMSLFLGTGIRVSELVGLDLKDINFLDNSLIVVRKGGKSMILYFNDSVAEALKDYMQLERPKGVSDPALFLSNRNKRISVKATENIVKKYTQEVTQKHITAHKLRATYGTMLYHETSDIKLVADVLGHSDINTTSKHYIDDSEEHRRIAGQLDLY